MIVVEGLDATGKTTLVKHLSEKFPDLVVHHSIGNKHDVKQIHDQAISSIMTDTPFDLWDRARFISEYVYNPILQNRPTAFDMPEWLSMLARWVEKPQLVIFCQRPLHKVREVLHNEEQLEGVEDNITKLYQAYALFMRMILFLFSVSPADSGIVWYDYEFPGDLGRVEIVVDEYLRRCSV